LRENLEAMKKRSLAPKLLWLQGIFYFLTGVWPLLHRSSFEKVTGPKTDFWLVKTVGVLIMVIGAVFMLAGNRRKVSMETALTAVGSAAGLTAIDLIYVVKGRISPVYLLDGLAEIGLLSLWTGVLYREPLQED
jgi:hypothetical protein